MERYTIRDYHRDLSAELIAPMPFALYWMHNLVTLDIELSEKGNVSFIMMFELELEHILKR